MKTKFIFILALVIVLAAFALSQYDTIDTGYAKSTPRNVGVDCADRKDCYVAIQKTTQNTMCRFNTNDAWSWLLDDNGNKIPCGGSDDKKPYDTSTPLPVVVDQPTKTQLPTATKQNDAPVPVQSTATQQSGNRNNPTVTLTPTYISGESPNQICNWCSLAEREAAAQETQAAAQATIAAGLSGDD